MSRREPIYALAAHERKGGGGGNEPPHNREDTMMNNGPKLTPAAQRIVRNMEREEKDKASAKRRRDAGLLDQLAAGREMAFRKSGVSREEWEAQEKSRREEGGARREEARQEAARQAELRAELTTSFVEAHAPAALGLPDAPAVALALSEVHLGGGSVRMVEMLQEAHLATAEDAARVAKSRVGKDLAGELRRLNWTHRRWGSGPVWTPPRA